MTIDIVDGPFDYEQHATTCPWPHHWWSTLGVYDQWGQRVNSKAVTHCGTDTPSPNLADEAGFTRLWPGCTLAFWGTGQEMSGTAPARLSDGPQPDLILHPEGAR